MYQKNLGKQIWAIISPVIVYQVVMFLVELVSMGIYFVQNLDKISALSGTQEEVMNGVVEVLYGVLDYTLIMMAVASALSIPILAYMMKRDRVKELAAGALPNAKAPISKYIWIILISIPFALGLNNLVNLANLAAYSEAYQETAQTFYSADFSLQIIALAICSPIVEEFMFRGLIYKRMRSVMPKPIHAIFFSGIVFGFYHGNLVQTIYGCFAGFLLAYIYEKYGSLKAPILAHVIMNLVAVILTEANVFVWMYKDIMRMGIITVICATVASSVFLMIQKIDEKPLKIEDK